MNVNPNCVNLRALSIRPRTAFHALVQTPLRRRHGASVCGGVAVLVRVDHPVPPAGIPIGHCWYKILTTPYLNKITSKLIG